MKARGSIASDIASVLVTLLSIGPLVTGLDLAFDILPTRWPAIRGFHAASPLGHALWIGAALLGMASIVLLRRQPLSAIASCLAFAAVYVIGAVMVWGRVTPGCWLALVAFALAVIGAVGSRKAGGRSEPMHVRDAS